MKDDGIENERESAEYTTASTRPLQKWLLVFAIVCCFRQMIYALACFSFSFFPSSLVFTTQFSSYCLHDECANWKCWLIFDLLYTVHAQVLYNVYALSAICIAKCYVSFLFWIRVKSVYLLQVFLLIISFCLYSLNPRYTVSSKSIASRLCVSCLAIWC